MHDNFTWNKERFNQDPNIKNLIKNKSGNLIDINLILITILKNRGVDAAPLVTRLRSHGYINDRFPCRGEFNDILPYISIGQGYLIVYPSDKDLDLGQISLANRNFSGLILHEKKGCRILIL